MIAASSWRRFYIVCNHSDTDVFISVDGDSGVTASTGSKPGVKVPAGGRFTSAELGHVPRNLLVSPIYCVHAGNTPKYVAVHEL